MDRIECDVLIVGAGVAGGAMACALKDSGLKVVLVEQNQKVLMLNRGDQLAPCVVRQLDKWGALPNIMKRGAQKITRWKAVGPEGETIIDLPLALTTPPPVNYIVTLHHPEIEEALLETARDSGKVDVRRGVRLNYLLKDDTGQVTGAMCVAGGEDELRIDAKVVVGCDGARSPVRSEAGIKTDLQFYKYEYLMLTCTYSTQQPADLNLEFWGQQGFLGLFPSTTGKVRAAVQAPTGEMSRWRQIGLQKVHDELKQRFPILAEMSVIDNELHAYKFARHNAETYVADGVLLTGDAAHGTPPYYGFGMGMAIRDAFHAARVITDVLTAGRKPDRAALLPFEQATRTFNQFVINASTVYGDIAAGGHKTAVEVQRALKTSTSLDPDVMSVIYADFDAPPPTHTDPARVSRLVQGSKDAIDVEPALLRDGFGFCEAPRWHDDRLWFVDYFSKQVLRCDEAGRVETVAEVPGTPGGLGFLPDGSPLVVSQSDFKLLSIGTGGQLKLVADLSAFCRGAANELLVDAKGRAYVGHHGFDFLGGGEMRPSSIVLVDGGRVREVATDLIFPNGMALTPDGGTLIVAESFANRISAFDVAADGSLSNRRVWADLPGLTPDGLCLDEGGGVWAGNPLANVFVRVEQGGRITDRVLVGGRWAVAAALGGADRKTLFCLTARTSIETMPQGLSKAAIETVRVARAGAGRP